MAALCANRVVFEKCPRVYPRLLALSARNNSSLTQAGHRPTNRRREFGRQLFRSARTLATSTQVDVGSNSNDAKQKNNNTAPFAVAAAALGSLGLALYLKNQRTAEQAECAAVKGSEVMVEQPMLKVVQPQIEAGVTCIDVQPGVPRDDLPTYRKADIEKHKDKESRIWVTYKSGVYDITDFVEGHPGGDRILLAAGGSVEPFWHTYAIHKSNAQVYSIMEELRIGNVHPDDLKTEKVIDASDPFAHEPERHPAFKVNSAKPFNAEPPPQLLVDSFLTPNELFFVRNHLPVPKIDNAEKHTVQVEGISIERPISLNIKDLQKKFKEYTIVATIQCAGNRRSHMRKYKEVKGLNWDTTAISNAEWTGVKLADVLAYAKADEDKVSHVLFQGLDKDLDGGSYEASIPAETAFDPRKDVLLAYKMNGEDIPPDHGYPLRVIVPGTVGARQVKWVNKIVLSEKESQSHWQQNDYKAFNSSTDWHNVDFSKAEPIQEYPLQSAICEPKDGTVYEPGETITMKGYAWSGGGRGILRVDVSIDGGKSWHNAKLLQVDQPRNRMWAWTLWEIELPAPDGQGEITLICKATDTSHNAQPESAEGIWNLRGLIHNAWHNVSVKVE